MVTFLYLQLSMCGPNIATQILTYDLFALLGIENPLAMDLRITLGMDLGMPLGMIF